MISSKVERVSFEFDKFGVDTRLCKLRIHWPLFLVCRCGNIVFMSDRRVSPFPLFPLFSLFLVELRVRYALHTTIIISGACPPPLTTPPTPFSAAPTTT